MANSKIKILFLDHTPFIGGAQLSLIDHLKTIDKEKFEVMFGCSVNAEKIGLTHDLEKFGIKYKILSFAKLKSLNPLVLYNLIKDILEVRSLIKKEKFDLVFANTVRTHILSSLAALFTKTKVIWFMQDFTFPLFLFKILKCLPDKIIYISKATAANYGEKVEANNIVYIGSDFYKNQITGEQIKNKKIEWNIVDDKTITIGYAGRLVEWKGADLLIKAVSELIHEGINNIKCVIIGSGDGQKGNNEAYLKKLVRENKLEDKVVFTGHRMDVFICMSAFDALCLTSIEPEPFGLVIVEAMMAKTLVFATNDGGPVEIINNRETGFLFEKNVTALTQVLKMAINDSGLRKKIINAAYEMAINNFSVKKMTEDFEKIYFDLLK
jgi:glycosyltransferase involved in cell wall biosynthesis